MSVISFSSGIKRDSFSHSSVNLSNNSSQNNNFVTTNQKNNNIINPKIVIIGVGGAGCNAVNNMIAKGIKDVTLYVANTDYQSLAKSQCENRIQLGSNVTNGLGAGSSPEIGEQAAQESIKEIEDAIANANMVFVTAGMGGGTGTGAAPVIANIARKKGILTIGVVTKPFKFERDRRMQSAEEGILKMSSVTDTLIVISNQNVFRIANEQTTLTDAFAKVDDVLCSGIRCITDLITEVGLVNLDFADIAAVMSHGGRSVMGEGESDDADDRAVIAAKAAITNPILEISSVKGAKGIIINITGGKDMTLFQVNDAIDTITQEIDPNAIIKFGSTIRDSMEGKIVVSIVATGIDENDLKINKNTKNNDDFFGLKNNNDKKIDLHSEQNNSFQNNIQNNYNSQKSLNNNNEASLIQQYQFTDKQSSFYNQAYRKVPQQNNQQVHQQNNQQNTQQLQQNQATNKNYQNYYNNKNNNNASNEINDYNSSNQNHVKENFYINNDGSLNQEIQNKDSLSSIKQLPKNFETNHQNNDTKRNDTKKFVIIDENNKLDDEIATKSVDKATSLFAKLLKKKE